jgi:hypothetical protein
MFSSSNIKDTSQVLIDELAQTIFRNINTLDLKAEEVRATYPAKGALITEEYDLALADAVKYMGDNSVIPATLQDFSDATGMSVSLCASTILETAGQYEWVLREVRRVRLLGKEAIRSATEDIESVTQSYMDQLDLLKSL